METVYQLSASNAENHIERLEMHSTDSIREWVSYPEAEQYCGLSHTTLWRYVKNGEISLVVLPEGRHSFRDQAGSALGGYG
jgi:hypothetical protein